ncbi:MAG: nitrogen regulation protein NR(I), partial [Congregibacter sp.]|nr:nitrogen regulation protein NR(I) [Congregibacter sp.]
TCRWLTVMASGREIHLSDLPVELGRNSDDSVREQETQWQELLCQWARSELVSGKQHILRDAIPAFEKALIEVALAHTRGRKRDAAELLGWGRNTLTRKMKELESDA